MKWLLEDLNPFLMRWHTSISFQHPGLLPAKFSSTGSGEGDPGAPETSSSSQFWCGGRWPGPFLWWAWPVHPQLEWEDGPLQPPLSYRQNRRGGARRQPPAQGQRSVSDSTYYPRRGGTGTKSFASLIKTVTFHFKKEDFQDVFKTNEVILLLTHFHISTPLSNNLKHNRPLVLLLYVSQNCNLFWNRNILECKKKRRKRTHFLHDFIHLNR